MHDLGAMPPSDSTMSTERFEQLLDSIPSLKVMTISPHLEAVCRYQRMEALLKRYGYESFKQPPSKLLSAWFLSASFPDSPHVPPTFPPRALAKINGEKFIFASARGGSLGTRLGFCSLISRRPGDEAMGFES